jgi:hypothetical protein
MLAPPKRGGLNSTHIHGTSVPVEEPSTASQLDQRHRSKTILFDHLLSIGFRASSFAFFSPAFLEATFPWAAFESCKPTCRRLTLRLALPRRFPQKPAIGRLAATVFGHKQGNKLGRPKQRTWRAIWSQGASFAALTSGALGGLVEIEVGMERCGVARRSGGGARPSDRGCAQPEVPRLQAYHGRDQHSVWPKVTSYA